MPRRMRADAGNRLQSAIWHPVMMYLAGLLLDLAWLLLGAALLVFLIAMIDWQEMHACGIL